VGEVEMLWRKRGNEGQRTRVDSDSPRRDRRRPPGDPRTADASGKAATPKRSRRAKLSSRRAASRWCPSTCTAVPSCRAGSGERKPPGKPVLGEVSRAQNSRHGDQLPDPRVTVESSVTHHCEQISNAFRSPRVTSSTDQDGESRNRSTSKISPSQLQDSHAL